MIFLANFLGGSKTPSSFSFLIRPLIFEWYIFTLKFSGWTKNYFKFLLFLLPLTFEWYVLHMSYYLFFMTEYCERYAKKEHMTNTVLEDSDDDISEDDISDGRSESSEDDVAGKADPWINGGPWNSTLVVSLFLSFVFYVTHCLLVNYWRRRLQTVSMLYRIRMDAYVWKK